MQPPAPSLTNTCGASSRCRRARSSPPPQGGWPRSACRRALTRWGGQAGAGDSGQAARCASDTACAGPAAAARRAGARHAHTNSGYAPLAALQVGLLVLDNRNNSAVVRKNFTVGLATAGALRNAPPVIGVRGKLLSGVAGRSFQLSGIADPEGSPFKVRACLAPTGACRAATRSAPARPCPGLLPGACRLGACSLASRTCAWSCLTPRAPPAPVPAPAGGLGGDDRHWPAHQAVWRGADRAAGQADAGAVQINHQRL